MQVIEDIVDTGHGKLNPQYLFVHETANPGATAWNHRQLYAGKEWQYAVQYVSDWTGNVYHTMPDNCLAWAVGKGNRYGVNLEICHATNQGDFEKAWITAVEFCAWYLKARGWTIDRMMSHDEARLKWGGTDHTDPVGYFKKYGKSWQQFKQEVYALLDKTPTYRNEDTKMREIAIPSGKYPVYRVYNPNAGDHHFTSNVREKDDLVKVGWKDEGIAWYGADTGYIVNRMYNPNAGDHYFTANYTEGATLVEAGWKWEGANFASARPSDPQAKAVYCLYNNNDGDHVFTVNKDERTALTAAGWADQGIVFYGL